MNRLLKLFGAWRDNWRRRAGLVQCDVCGHWGRPNLNYKGCGGTAFVHTTHGGTQYVHAIHAIRSMVTQMREAKSDD